MSTKNSIATHYNIFSLAHRAVLLYHLHMQNSAQKQNYAAMLNANLAQIEKQISLTQKRPSLLLHACCAPCSSYVLEYLNKFFAITILYYNPNIHPETEYLRRLNELKNFLPGFCAETPQAKITLVQDEYLPKEFFDAVNAERDGLEHEAERGERCRRCYKLRMERAFDYAVQNRFDFFTTTLSISPHKDAQKINAIGFELEKKNSSKTQFPTKFLAADFKKQNGFKRSLELSKKYGLYRQDYCGCVYSKEMQTQRHCVYSKENLR